MNPLRLPIPLLALLAVFLLSSCGADSTDSTSAGLSSAGPVAPPAKEAEGRSDGNAKGAATRTQGGGSGGSAEPDRGRQAPAEPNFAPRPHHDSGGGAAQFRTEGGDNSIQEYGGEPPSAEFEEAAAALHEYLDARAAGAWGAACGRLSQAVTEQLVSQLGASTGGAKPGCPEVLAGLSSGISGSVLREAARVDVSALRVEGERGFLLFHDVHDADLFIPMVREEGRWKVAAIAPSPLS